MVQMINTNINIYKSYITNGFSSSNIYVINSSFNQSTIDGIEFYISSNGTVNFTVKKISYLN